MKKQGCSKLNKAPCTNTPQCEWNKRCVKKKKDVVQQVRTPNSSPKQKYMIIVAEAALRKVFKLAHDGPQRLSKGYVEGINHFIYRFCKFILRGEKKSITHEDIIHSFDDQQDYSMPDFFIKSIRYKNLYTKTFKSRIDICFKKDLTYDAAKRLAFILERMIIDLHTYAVGAAVHGLVEEQHMYEIVESSPSFDDLFRIIGMRGP